MGALIDWIGVRNLPGFADAELALDGRCLAVLTTEPRWGSALVDALERSLGSDSGDDAGVRVGLRADEVTVEVGRGTHVDGLPEVVRRYIRAVRAAPFVVRRSDAAALVGASDAARFRALSTFLALDGHDGLVDLCARARGVAEARQRSCARSYEDVVGEVEARLGPEPSAEFVDRWVADRATRLGWGPVGLAELARRADGDHGLPAELAWAVRALPGYLRAGEALAWAGGIAERAVIVARHAAAERDDTLVDAVDGFAAATTALLAALWPTWAAPIGWRADLAQAMAGLTVGARQDGTEPARSAVGVAASLALGLAGGDCGPLVLDDLTWPEEPPDVEALTRAAGRRQLVVTTRSPAWFARLDGSAFRRAEVLVTGARAAVRAVG